MEELLKNTIEDLEKTHSELGKMKNQLLSMSLDSFSYLFDGKDPLYKNMNKESRDETVSALEKDLLPLFEEIEYKEGIKKIKKYIKLLNE